MVTRALTGGDKLDRYLSDLARKVTGSPSLAVGFLAGATYPDGTSVAMVAAIQNFGAPKRGIPPRPYFTNMISKHGDEWGPALGRLLQANDFDAERALGQMGMGIKGQLQTAIVDTMSPPLSPLTLVIRAWKSAHPGEPVTGKLVGQLAAQMRDVERYGPVDVSGVSTKPLIDTSLMLNAVDFRVAA